jgi:hypothetical protein
MWMEAGLPRNEDEKRAFSSNPVLFSETMIIEKQSQFVNISLTASDRRILTG